MDMEPTSITVVYSETSQENAEYKLEVRVFMESEVAKYWLHIFKQTHDPRMPWLSVTHDSIRLRPGEVSEENFQRLCPPVYDSLSEAIIKGKELLNKCVKDEISW